MDQLNETSQDKLFRHCRSEQHCLHHFLSSNPGRLVPCTLDNVGMILSYRTASMILYNKRHFLARLLFIMSKFYVFVLCICVYVL